LSINASGSAIKGDFVVKVRGYDGNKAGLGGLLTGLQDNISTPCGITWQANGRLSERINKPTRRSALGWGTSQLLGPILTLFLSQILSRFPKTLYRRQHQPTKYGP
jgi:hypothetical protein